MMFFNVCKFRLFTLTALFTLGFLLPRTNAQQQIETIERFLERIETASNEDEKFNYIDSLVNHSDISTYAPQKAVTHNLSYLKLAKQKRNEEAKFRAYSNLSTIYSLKIPKYDSALHWLNLMREKGYEIDNYFGELQYQLNLARLLTIEGKNKEALSRLDTAERVGVKNKTEGIEMYYIYGTKAKIYFDLGQYQNCIDENIKSIEHIKNSSNTRNYTRYSSDIYSNIGNVYKEMGLSEKSKESFKLAMKIAKDAGNFPRYSFHGYNLSALLLELDSLNAAEKIIAECLPYSKSAKDTTNVIDLKTILTKVLLNKGDLPKAEMEMKGLLHFFNNFSGKNWFTETQIAHTRTNIFLKKSKTKEAEATSKIVMRNALKTGNVQFIQWAKHLELNVLDALGNYKEWKEKATIYYERQDSIREAQKSEQLAITEANYKNYEQEKEIEILEKDKALLAVQTAQTRTAALSIGAFALLALGFFFNARRKNNIIAAAKDQLEQLNHTKDRIFAIIGHDLRKPVVAFSGISETINYLVKKEDYATLQQLGSEIEKDGFALQKLTDNLLNWALTQRDVMPYNPTQVDVSQKAEEIALIFKNVARDKNIELVNAIPEGQTAYADPNALLTILVNLTDNALKYTPEGGRVEITAENSDEGLQIRVSDTGVGIAAEQLKDIFLLQKDKSQKGTEGEKGTGLGLHLVNELVKLNGGEIAAESAVGEGTTFSVLLPERSSKAA